MPKYINIPIITDLVYSGDPRLKARAKDNKAINPHLKELNKRIDQIETAIGQDATGPVGRAFAIRAEKKEAKIKRTVKKPVDRVLSDEDIIKY